MNLAAIRLILLSMTVQAHTRKVVTVVHHLPAETEAEAKAEAEAEAKAEAEAEAEANLQSRRSTRHLLNTMQVISSILQPKNRLS